MQVHCLRTPALGDPPKIKNYNMLNDCYVFCQASLLPVS